MKRLLRFAVISAALARGILRALLVGAVLCALGCPSVLPPVSGCEPYTTRCADDGQPETCSSTRRWERHPTLVPCAAPLTCCPTVSPYGRALHACVPADRCQPTDGGLR